MTTLLNSGLDAFFYGRRLGHTDATRQITVVVGGTDYTATIEEDIYTSIAGTEYADIHSAIVDALDASTPLSWAFDRVDLSAHGRDWPNFGARLLTDQNFELDTDESSPELLRILGWTPGQGLLSSQGSALDPDGPFGLVWRSPTTADRKKRNTIHEQETSGGRGGRPQLSRWGTDRVRMFVYSNIPAVHVIEGRPGTSLYSTVGQVGEQWSQVAMYYLHLYGISDYSHIYGVYNEGFTSTVTGWTDYDDREVLHSPIGSSYADEFEQVKTRDTSRSAEYYDIEFVLRVEESHWGQG